MIKKKVQGSKSFSAIKKKRSHESLRTIKESLLLITNEQSFDEFE